MFVKINTPTGPKEDNFYYKLLICPVITTVKTFWSLSSLAIYEWELSNVKSTTET